MERRNIMAYKVLVINGSPHVHGCTARALDEVIAALNAEGVETELMQIGSKKLSGCLACNYCDKGEGCVQKDIVNEAAEKLMKADGLLVGSPVYYASPNGTLISFLDRLFYSLEGSLHMMVGAAGVSCRRGGAASAFDVLNKYFTIAGMPVASSSYWNSVHGFTAADVENDLEGLQVMRNLGRNMAFLI
jgi:multimeric flavodoxin WrbA